MPAKPPLEQTLTGFVRALRAAGTTTSTAETLDAARAVSLLGWSDRDVLKAALGAALAKSAAEKRLHDNLFEQYFAAVIPEESMPGCRRDDGDGDSAVGSVAVGGADMPGNPAVDALRRLVAGSRKGAAQSAALTHALARAAEAESVDDIRFVTQIPYLAGRMLHALGISALDARLAQLVAQNQPAARLEAQLLQQVRTRLQQEARAWVTRRFRLFGRAATENFMTDVLVHRPIGRLAPTEMARMKTAVARMARRLAQRHLRRQQRRERGTLDMRRTLRANAGHDGVPFRIEWRLRKHDRPRIVVVCDVSGSVAAHVRFLLLFLQAMHDVVDDLRTFAFSNDLHDVGALLDTASFDDAMTLIIRKAGSGSTDYGQAWASLAVDHAGCIDRRTTLIVLGDGRSNGTDPRIDLFSSFAQQAKRVVWLCPEPAGRWGTGDSEILRYLPWCTDLRHCATPLDLERTLDEALLAYR